MTITLDGQNELPLHPLDLTVEPAGQQNSQYCIGLIQTDPSQLTAPSDSVDMILGVPFMRNVYTVMAYEQPDTTGNFNNSIASGINPTLGLLSLTNATQAMEQFDQVRVLKQPLGSGSSQQGSSPQSGGSQRSIGLEILIGLVSFFVLCLALFALRWLFARRRLRQSSPLEREEDRSDQKLEYGAYRSARSDSQSSVDQSTLLYDSSLHKDNPLQYAVNESRMRVKDDDSAEFGMQRSKLRLGGSPTDVEIYAHWDSHASTWCDTLVGTEAGEPTSVKSHFRPRDLDLADLGFDSPHPSSPELTSALLTAWHDRSDSQTSDPGDAFEMHSMGMAGVGTAARGCVIDVSLQHGRPSCESVRSSTPLRSAHASCLRSSHTFASPTSPHTHEPSVGASCDADRTF